MAEGTLRYTNEVEQAVINAGIGDLELAHGAGLIADPYAFDLLPQESHEVRERQVVGVTAVSLDRRGEATYRTATFGVTAPDSVVAVEARGSSRVVDLGVATDKRPRRTALSTYRPVMEARYAAAQQRGRCVLGGTVVWLDYDNHLQSRSFMSAHFRDVLLEDIDNPVMQKLAVGAAKVIRAVRSPKGSFAGRQMSREERMTAAAWTVYIETVSKAKRRSGPVVIDKPFVATL